MRFERYEKGEKMFAAMLDRADGQMIMYAAKAGDWQFLISHDTLHDKWAASWQTLFMQPGKRYSSNQCEPPEPGQKVKYYKSQHEAEQACFRKYRELRANN